MVKNNVTRRRVMVVASEEINEGEMYLKSDRKIKSISMIRNPNDASTQFSHTNKIPIYFSFGGIESVVKESISDEAINFYIFINPEDYSNLGFKTDFDSCRITIEYEEQEIPQK